MRVVAVGPTETLLGLMLGGIKERFETDEPSDAIEYLSGLAAKETSCLIIIASGIFKEIEDEIGEIQERRRSFIFYEFSGGRLKWRQQQ